MNTLLLQALKKAGQVRTKLGINIFSPLNIFDACANLGVTVRFIDVSMEGMYVNQEAAPNQVILISSLRPMPRRVFTCGHELGHHIFGHGSRIDGLNEEDASKSIYDKDEYLVDAFAGAFLMPIAGIEAEFIKRNWTLSSATPIQFFTISSIFGTGYSTLITHCKANKLITDTKAISLLRQTPAKLLQQIMTIPVNNSHFKIIDNKTNITVIDLEVGNYLFLPYNSVVDGTHLRKLSTTDYGEAFIVEHAGIVRTTSFEGGPSFFIRIQKEGYIGLAENRHLEDKVECI